MPNWDEKMAQHLLEKFELDEKKKIGKLSKGMMSMVTIIIALASKADYTFLDEPVAGLDVVMREYFYRVLLDEFTDSGRTFVISTHIIEAGDELKKKCNNIEYVYLPTVMEGAVPRYTYKLEKGITADRHGMIIIRNEGILDILKK